MEAHSCRLQLRGARRQVLTAVLALLCGWSRITDGRVGLAQVVELVAAAGGRRYDLKTIGWALAGLAADDLIVYRPAQGRGRRAFIAIHDRFVGNIAVLERDRCGRVITNYSGRSGTDSVTFSSRSPSIRRPSSRQSDVTYSVTTAPAFITPADSAARSRTAMADSAQDAALEAACA